MQETLPGTETSYSTRWRVYHYIAQFIVAEQMPPTVREIQNALSLVAPSHVFHHIRQLEGHGLLIHKRARTTRNWYVPQLDPTLAAQQEYHATLLPLAESFQEDLLRFRVNSSYYQAAMHICCGDTLTVSAKISHDSCYRLALHIPQDAVHPPHLTLLPGEAGQATEEWLILGTVVSILRLV